MPRPNQICRLMMLLSDIPGNPDYTVPEMKDELAKKLDENMINGRIGFKEQKYIWRAVKP